MKALDRGRGATVKIVIAAVFLGLFSEQACAGFINNFGDWQKLTSSKKSGYVMGWLDLTVGVIQDDPAYTLGVKACAIGVGLNSTMLVERIDQKYNNETSLWNRSPAIVLWFVTRDICLTYINAERTKRGLDPWER